MNDALRNGARCISTVNEAMRIKVHEGKRQGDIVSEFTGIVRHSDRHQSEFRVAAVLRACRSVTERHLTAKLVTFAHSRQPTPEMNRFFGAKVGFGADADEMTFAGTIRDAAVVTADEYLNELLIRYCDEVLADQRDRGLFSASVENAIAVLLPHGKARMSEVARRLGRSKKTRCQAIGIRGSNIRRYTAPSSHRSGEAPFGG